MIKVEISLPNVEYLGSKGKSHIERFSFEDEKEGTEKFKFELFKNERERWYLSSKTVLAYLKDKISLRSESKAALFFSSILTYQAAQ